MNLYGSRSTISVLSFLVYLDFLATEYLQRLLLSLLWQLELLI